MDAIDLAAFRAAVLTRQPFAYLVVPGFIKPAARAAINADFPHIEAPGSFPATELRYGPAFAALLQALTGAEVRAAFEDKFQISLKNRPTMITVRGRCGTRDGQIHTDAETKIITALVYLNPSWEEQGGRLRLLRSDHDLDDLLLEVPPMEGTLLAFRRNDCSFHGHKPFIGPRRVIQLNWVTSRLVKHSELMRHRLSAWMKKLQTWVQPPAADPTALR
jgi:hypothetical protein